jgi:hypothetical protein
MQRERYGVNRLEKPPSKDVYSGRMDLVMGSQQHLASLVFGAGD